MNTITSKTHRAVIVVTMAIAMLLSSCNIIRTVDSGIRQAETSLDSGICAPNCYNMGE